MSEPSNTYIVTKTCMICGGKEHQKFPIKMVVTTTKESICNRCKAVLRDTVMQAVGLNKNAEAAFNWD